MNPEKIKQIRLRLGWSQEKLARELGVSFCTVNRWEKGRTSPSPMAIRGLERLDETGVDEDSGKRTAFRLKARCPISVRIREQTQMDTNMLGVPTFSATTENLSSTGLMFKTQRPVTEGETLRIGWSFGKDKHFEVLSKVVWTSNGDLENSVGVHFDNPMPNVISTVLDSLIAQ